MKQLALAFKAFFRILGDAPLAEKIERLLGDGEAKPDEIAAPPPEPEPTRSEALTLLAALQREGRLVDFLMEPIDGYQDAQIGAAVRDVHRDCAAILRRMFDPAPLRGEAEGSSVEIAAGFDPTAVQLSGNLGGQPPYRGQLRHAGWVARRCELPLWTGRPENARVIAPSEVELS